MNGLRPIGDTDHYIVTEGHFRHSKLSDVVRWNRHWLSGWFKQVTQNSETNAVVEAAIAEFEKERWDE